MPKSKKRKPSSTRKPPARQAAKAAAARPAPRVSSLLKKIPLLIFEPELLHLDFPPEALAREHGTGRPAPDVIEALADEPFEADVRARLRALLVRAETEGRETLRFLADAVRYYMEEQQSPPFDNPLIVCLYNRGVWRLEGRRITHSACLQAARAYDRQWSAHIEAKLAAGRAADAPQAADAGTPDEPAP